MIVRTKAVLTIVGSVLAALSAVALLGWIQESDPDCILETGVFLQLRMCAPELVGEPQWPSFVRLAVILAAFVVGMLCLWFGRRIKR
jgi:hypothetical protein